MSLRRSEHPQELQSAHASALRKPCPGQNCPSGEVDRATLGAGWQQTDLFSGDHALPQRARQVGWTRSPQRPQRTSLFCRTPKDEMHHSIVHRFLLGPVWARGGLMPISLLKHQALGKPGPTGIRGPLGSTGLRSGTQAHESPPSPIWVCCGHEASFLLPCCCVRGRVGLVLSSSWGCDGDTLFAEAPSTQILH